MLKLKIYFWINGLFLAILGGLMLFLSKETMNLLIGIFAIENLLSLGYLRYVMGTDIPRSYRMGMWSWSLLQLIFALALLFFPQFGRFLMSTLVVIFGIGITGIGISIFLDAFKIKNAGIPNRGLYLGLGLIITATGIFVLTNSVLTIVILEKLFGISFLISGISLIINGFKLPSQAKSVLFIDEEE